MRQSLHFRKGLHARPSQEVRVIFTLTPSGSSSHPVIGTHYLQLVNLQPDVGVQGEPATSGTAPGGGVGGAGRCRGDCRHGQRGGHGGLGMLEMGWRGDAVGRQDGGGLRAGALGDCRGPLQGNCEHSVQNALMDSGFSARRGK